MRNSECGLRNGWVSVEARCAPQRRPCHSMRNSECGLRNGWVSVEARCAPQRRPCHSAFRIQHSAFRSFRIPNSTFPWASTRARADFELRLQSAHRAPAHEYPELPGLHDELHVLVVEPQLLRGELEVHRARFTRLEGDPTEPG